ncbi:MAG: GYD domain-containing protein [Acidimicrobiales bacterium]|nr:GYD domain-containing protein [Acidimicrobiales bacterium]
MAKFVMLSTLGPDGAATLREHPARILEVNAEVEAMGGKVLQQYALLGQWDFLNIIEAPDEKTMARIATELSARGTLKTRTMVAVEVHEFIEAIEQGRRS